MEGDAPAPAPKPRPRPRPAPGSHSTTEIKTDQVQDAPAVAPRPRPPKQSSEVPDKDVSGDIPRPITPVRARPPPPKSFAPQAEEEPAPKASLPQTTVFSDQPHAAGQEPPVSPKPRPTKTPTQTTEFIGAEPPASPTIDHAPSPIASPRLTAPMSPTTRRPAPSPPSRHRRSISTPVSGPLVNAQGEVAVADVPSSPTARSPVMRSDTASLARQASVGTGSQNVSNLSASDSTTSPGAKKYRPPPGSANAQLAAIMTARLKAQSPSHEDEPPAQVVPEVGAAEDASPHEDEDEESLPTPDPGHIEELQDDPAADPNRPKWMPPTAHPGAGVLAMALGLQKKAPPPPPPVTHDTVEDANVSLEDEETADVAEETHGAGDLVETPSVEISKPPEEPAHTTDIPDEPPRTPTSPKPPRPPSPRFFPPASETTTSSVEPPTHAAAPLSDPLEPYLRELRLHKCHVAETTTIPQTNLLEASGKLPETHTKALKKAVATLQGRTKKLHQKTEDRLAKERKNLTSKAAKAEAKLAKEEQSAKKKGKDIRADLASEAMKLDLEYLEAYRKEYLNLINGTVIEEIDVYTDLQEAELHTLSELESEEKKEMSKRHKAEHEALQKEMKKARSTDTGRQTEQSERHDQERKELAEAHRVRRDHVVSYHLDLQKHVRDDLNQQVAMLHSQQQ